MATATFGAPMTGDIDDTDIENIIKGCWGTPTHNGHVISISAHISKTTTSTHNIKAALYEYIDYGTNWAGALLGVTEELTKDTIALEWLTFKFPHDRKPEVAANIKYYVMVWANDAGGDINVRYVAGAGTSVFAGTVYNNFPNPLTGEASSGVTYQIYGTYEISSGLRLGLGLGGQGGNEGGRIPHLDPGLGLQRHPRSRAH